MQRKWPGLLSVPLLEGRRDTSEIDAGPRRGLTIAYTRRQRLQDVLQSEGHFSTPAPTFSDRLSQLVCSLLTQVIHAPLSAPKAISHAGSSD